MGTIGIHLFPGVEELDAVGPWEVLACWARRWPDDGWKVVTFSRVADELVAANGLRMRADHDWATLPALDVVVWPGGPGVWQQLEDPDQLDWVRRQADRGTLMTSVCTGSLVLAAAGVLAGRRATTYWASIDTLAELDPTIEVSPDERWVDTGEVITASGVSAGIDMALHLVRRLAGAERARQVRKVIQYDPVPPV